MQYFKAIVIFFKGPSCIFGLIDNPVGNFDTRFLNRHYVELPDILIDRADVIQQNDPRTGNCFGTVISHRSGSKLTIIHGTKYVVLASCEDEKLESVRLIAAMPVNEYHQRISLMQPVPVDFDADTIFIFQLTEQKREVRGTMMHIVDTLIKFFNGNPHGSMVNPNNKWWTRFDDDVSDTRVYPVIPTITADYVRLTLETPVAKPSTPKPTNKKKGVKGVEPKPPKKFTAAEKVPPKTAKKVAKKTVVKKNS